MIGRVGVVAAVAVGAAVVAVGAYAAFRATVLNPGNSFSAGSVALSDNDAGSALFTALTSVAPGDSQTNCIRVRFDGTLDSVVHLYGTVSGALAPYLTLTVTRGTDPTPSFGSCSSFTADATNYVGAGSGVVYNGALSTFPSTYAAGIVDPAVAGGTETWTQNEAHTYKFALSVGSNTAGQGQLATAAFTWEARSQ